MALTSIDPFPRDGETIHTVVEATGGTLSISDQRVRVSIPGARRPALDMPLAGLGRIQFDIELDRPATFVIVPPHVDNNPEVLAIPPSQYEAIASGLARVGKFLAANGNGKL